MCLWLPLPDGRRVYRLLGHNGRHNHRVGAALADMELVVGHSYLPRVPDLAAREVGIRGERSPDSKRFIGHIHAHFVVGIPLRIVNAQYPEQGGIPGHLRSEAIGALALGLRTRLARNSGRHCTGGDRGLDVHGAYALGRYRRVDPLGQHYHDYSGVFPSGGVGTEGHRWVCRTRR